MSDSVQFPQIPFNEVLKRINAGATVVTPNRRLALALKEKFNQNQINQKLTVWYSSDILPFAALIERIYLDTLYLSQSSVLPQSLSNVQEQILWESVIESSSTGRSLLRIPQAAQWVREAWQLAHEWQLIPKLKNYYPNEDGKAFLDWIESYQQITAHRRQSDQTRICDLITEQYEYLHIKEIASLICYGFDIYTPQQITFLKKLTSTGCDVVVASTVSKNLQHSGGALRIGCINSRAEIRQAAEWARAKIEANSAARIGIVVPALADYRSEIVRVFNAVMYPDIRLTFPGAVRPIAPFNISLGQALTSYPLVDAACACLALLGQEIEFNRLSHWLRSPFLAGAETEREQRALLDARIRRNAEPMISLDRLMTLVQKAGGQAACPILIQHLLALIEFRRTRISQSDRHAVFSKIFSEALKIIGFPGERGLDSSEFQTLKKWHEVVASFASLDLVNPKVSYAEAVGRLRRMAADTLFQPETPDVPIQILGILEAAGMDFDHLWVMGLSDEQWPLRSRPNPFLPIELQREAKLPLCSTAESLAYSRRLTNGWISGANEVILSFPRFSDDRDGHELKPSLLIKCIPEGQPVFPAIIQHRDLIIQSGELECLEDSQAPPLDKETIQYGIKGGTSVIKDYAACAFRAWAKHRLHINSLDEPHPGLNAMERGSLVHQVLAHIWSQLKTKEALDNIDSHDLENLLDSAAQHAVLQMQQHKPVALSGRFAQIEKQRLVRLIREWLQEEKKRDPFTVIAIEEKHNIQVGDLILHGRLDRVDELGNGQHIVIDYKTRKQSIQTMMGERPDEPQLPLYLVMTEAQHAAGVAFAAVKLGAMGLTGIVRDVDLLPGAKVFSELNGDQPFNSWEELIATWQQLLTNLADGFSSGDAKVDPKNFPVTCEYCDMQLFCRIYERIGATLIEQEE